MNEIRAKADIVDVVSRYIPVTRKGKGFYATCPFHDDHDPSMSISQDKQIFKCFVCGAGGNVFSFVQKYENISFLEAVYKVAEFTGITLDKSLVLPQRKIDPHIAALYKVCSDMIEYTHYQLDTPDAANVKEYLYKRGLSDDIINRFELGYNPEHEAVYKFLHAKKHEDEDMLAAGVARLTSNGIKDVFFHRITIPIHDAQGNPVGFSARRILDNEDAKYINTQETEIYHKGDLLFNYHRAKSEARKAKRVYLVEGAMDVLALEKVECHHAIATLGTACTKEQLKLISMLGVDVVLCYDGDQAGKNATYKFGKLATQLNFTIVDNKLGLDPDEIIDAYGKEELQRLLNKTISWIDFLFDYLLNRYDLENYSQKKEYAMELAEAINALKDDFEKQNYFIRLRELTGFDMQTNIATNAPNKAQERTKQSKRVFLKDPKNGTLAAEYVILSQMLTGLSASNIFKDELGYLKDEDGNKLAMYIIDYYRTHKQMQVADLINVIKEENVKALLLTISEWELAQNEVNMDVLREAITKMNACLLDEKIALLKEQAKAMNDPIMKAKIADERNTLIRKRNDLILRKE